MILTIFYSFFLHLLCIVWFILLRKNLGFFFIIGLIFRIIGTIAGFIFFLFIYKYHSHDFIPMCEKAYEFLRFQIN
jgi:hypothetical protein